MQEPFHEARAEKTLYKVYHQCVEEFFMPKKDTWYENSRAAYTGQSAIEFYQQVPDSRGAFCFRSAVNFCACGKNWRNMKHQAQIWHQSDKNSSFWESFLCESDAIGIHKSWTCA